MDSRTAINDLLSQIGTPIKFSLNEEGFCDLAYEELDLVISVPEGSDLVHLYGFILPEKPELFEKLLKINLLRIDTKGAFFALNEREKYIVLVQTQPVEGLNFSQFETLLQNFIETSLNWQNKLTQKEPIKTKRDEILENLKYKI